MIRISIKHLVFIIPLLLGAWGIMGQTTVKGKIVDAETGETLIGATAVIEGTSIGAASDPDGNFTIYCTKEGEITLIFRNVGYEEQQKSVSLEHSVTDLGVIKLQASTVGLEEVKVTASIVSKDRATPIAVSNITPEIIEERLGNQEFPEIMKSTPSIYATKSGGGYGDSRVNLRGFDSNNIGILINGVPINDMENGKVYWSNWSALSDVTQFIQVQRGLGASKLAVNSVGGTMNMITRNTDAKIGGSVYYGVGHDGFQKVAINVSTGLMSNGWAVSIAGSTTESTRGYVEATDYKAWMYFLNISKRINDNHRLSFTLFGAPQWHNQRGQMHTIQEFRDHPSGIRWNSSYGYLNGKVFNGPYAYNEYHKPQLSLNHYWKIDDQSSLSTAAYVSFAKGGARRAFGTKKNWLQYNNTTGKPYVGTNADTQLTPDGLLDYNAVLRENAASQTGSLLVLGTAVNAHDWYGILSTYTNDLTQEFKLTAGLDGRYYKGYHYNKITDLMGGSYYEGDYLAYQQKGTPKYKGDRLGYENTSEVLWVGTFAQLEYVKDNFSAFLSASLTENAYRRIDDGNYAPGDPMRKSSWQTFLPWGVKGGANYKFGRIHNVFVNGGYFKRAPYMNIVFKNNTNELTPSVKYESVYTFEGGYGLTLPKLSVNVNYYYTEWRDRGLNKNMGNGIFATMHGVNARHHGVEFEAVYKPVYNFTLRGMFSWGDWILTDNPIVSLFDSNNKLISENDQLYVKNVHVGNSAQMTAALNASYEPFDNFRVGAAWNLFDKNYADYAIEDRTSSREAGLDAWKLPRFCTFDANVNYQLPLVKNIRATLYINVNNLFNTKYIADAKDGVYHDEFSSLVYYGFGRTWTMGFKVRF